MSSEISMNVESLFYSLSKDWFSHREGSYESHRRSGVFSVALTTWLMILQRLSGMPLQGALVETLNDERKGIFAQLNKKSKKLTYGTVSNNSGGFARARDRLVPQEVTDLVKHCESKLRKKLVDTGSFYLLDGTCMTTAYSKSNESRYPRHIAGVNKKMHYPRMRVVTAHSLANGTALEPIHGTINDSEQALTWNYLESLPANSTVMGDRNFGIFSVAYRATTLGHKVLFRMTDTRFKSIVGKDTGQNIHTQKNWMSSANDRRTTPSIPKDASVEGFFIKICVETAGFRPQVLYFFTTLDMPPVEIAALYLRRQRIETHISQLKQILKLEFISAKTPERIQKELSIAFLTFNLISAVMTAAAKHNNIPFERISFTAAIRIISAYGSQLQNASSTAHRERIIERMFIAFNQTKIPLRKKQRSYPRVVKRKNTKFPTRAVVENLIVNNQEVILEGK
jgi:hypothetical protein